MSEPGGTPVLAASGLRKEFGDLVAVKDVSFTVPAGNSLAIVGESGSGKTTIARMVVGLERPTAGTITACSRDRSRPARSAKERRRRGREVQIVFQDPYGSLSPRMSIYQIVEEGLLVHGGKIDQDARPELIAEALTEVGLDAASMHRYPHEFSGGQRQRIVIARALAVEPKFIVCDEPISDLDVSLQAPVVNLLEELQDEFNLTSLFIAHDLSMVRHICDRVAVMYLGIIVEMATRDELYENPLHPYTQALLSAVPIPNPKRDRQRHCEDGDDLHRQGILRTADEHVRRTA